MTFDLAGSLPILERTPDVLRTWLPGLDTSWTERDEGTGTWSPRVIVGHLVVGEETDWIPRARIILEYGEAKTFEPFDRFLQLRKYGDWDVPRLVDRFAALRAENLATLRGLRLGEGDLAKKGRHPAFGEVTLGELLATWVVHDLGHLAQIARVMAKGLRTDVGSWREYLPVLDDRSRSRF
jgi:hypothetical protein